MIKAVFFDYDGVLTTDKTGSLTTTRHLSKATGIELSVVKATFNRYNRDLTLGKTTHIQVWHEICSALGQKLDIRLLFEAFESTRRNGDEAIRRLIQSIVLAPSFRSRSGQAAP